MIRGNLKITALARASGQEALLQQIALQALKVMSNHSMTNSSRRHADLRVCLDVWLGICMYV